MSQGNYRSFRHLICGGLALAACAFSLAGAPDENTSLPGRGNAAPSQQIAGPLLGFIPTAGRQGVRGIWGIPGAAGLSGEEDLGVPLRQVYFSPAGYLLGVEHSGAVSVFVRLDQSWRRHPLGRFSVDVVAFSPSGMNAACWDAQTQRVRVFRDLFAATGPAWEAQPGALAGAQLALALNEGADLVALASTQPGGGPLLVFRQDGATRAIGHWGAIAGLTFLGRLPALALADREANRVVWFRDVAASPAWEPLLSEQDGLTTPVALASSRDGGLLVALSERDGAIVSLDMAARRVTTTKVAGKAEGFWPMAGNAVFLLSHDAAQPLQVFDGDRGEPRVMFIPADPALARTTGSGHDPQPGGRRSR